MQYILSEEEYTALARTNYQFEKLEIELAKEKEKVRFLQSEYNSLQGKYNELLLFGVIPLNKRCKG